MRALLVLCVLSRVAAAEHEPLFTKTFGKGQDVAEFDLPAGDQTHLVIGRYDGKAGVLLLRCGSTPCESRRIELGTTDAIEVAGVFDLEGKPTELPTRGVTKLRGAKTMKFPVVAIVTREQRRKKLYLISLLEADRGSTVLMDTITDKGFTRSYRLEAGDTKDRLELVVKHKRKDCETEMVLSLEEHHLRTKKAEAGCW